MHEYVCAIMKFHHFQDSILLGIPYFQNSGNLEFQKFKILGILNSRILVIELCYCNGVPSFP